MSPLEYKRLRQDEAFERQFVCFPYAFYHAAQHLGVDIDKANIPNKAYSLTEATRFVMLSGFSVRLNVPLFLLFNPAILAAFIASNKTGGISRSSAATHYAKIYIGTAWQIYGIHEYWTHFVAVCSSGDNHRICDAYYPQIRIASGNTFMDYGNLDALPHLLITS